MAIAYLNKGAVSLASANWSDSTGFADDATLVINKSFGGGQPLTSDTDYSSLTEGINYLDIRAGAQGQLGNGSNPLKVDADTDSGSTAADYIANFGSGVTLFLQAGGDDTLILNFTMGNQPVGLPNTSNLVGGTYTNVGMMNGTLNANQSTVITNYDQYGGYAEIDYNSTAITAARIMGGTCIIKRLVTTLTVGKDARVIYDPDDQISSFSGTTINQYGGYLVQKRGATPTILSLAGTHDFSQLREAATPGGTSWSVGGASIVESPNLTTTNVEYVFDIKRNVGGPIPIP